MKPLKKCATYADLRAVPDNFVAEIFDGELYAFPRPALPHAHAGSVLGYTLGSFHRTGPGGWVLLDEPELHFEADVLVPDIAGWRRERLPVVPRDAYLRGARSRGSLRRHRARARRTLDRVTARSREFGRVAGLRLENWAAS